MFTRYTLPGFILLLSITGCTSQKKVTAHQEFKGKVLQFGSGGGFAGVANTYTLLENGQLFSEISVAGSAAKTWPDANKKTVKALFDAAQKMEWKEGRISHPGNIYYTLTYKSGNTTYEIIWGDGQYEPPAAVKKLHEDLFKLVNM